ncbi:uncharacterized protein LOC122390163 isoform X1 [Amphibalanus amphitrite]|uniref:uncharacterized protein LOC122390163 isoform X1 n=1 Tax=Amphibalanus amphitrite TaxID=1232801 RepID=UPI001C921D39|nr:uncharacterized protein LOC122390163 isoform X1 [Amphibalanus amphitrite]
MAGRPLSTVLGLLALAALGQCLNCNVCIPPLAGDKPSQKEAEIWRAKIGRTFPGMAVSDIQVCGEKVDPNKKPKETEGSCPWNTDDVVCLKIKHATVIAAAGGTRPAPRLSSRSSSASRWRPPGRAPRQTPGWPRRPANGVNRRAAIREAYTSRGADCKLASSSGCPAERASSSK